MRSHQHETNLQPQSRHSQAETENLQPDVLSNIAPPLAHPAMIQPSPAHPQAILQLQRQYGNRYVNRVLQQSQSSRPMPIQAKMRLGEVGDKYEQEADRVAKQVVNQINALTPASTLHQNVQRETMPNENQELIKPFIQSQAEVGGGKSVTPDFESSINQAKGKGKPLDQEIREPMEKAFGADFSLVKVHTDTQSDELNQSIQSRAFTTGKDIFFQPSEYNPKALDGQKLIAHELTHVIQQNDNLNKAASMPDFIQRTPKKLKKIWRYITRRRDTSSSVPDEDLSELETSYEEQRRRDTSSSVPDEDLSELETSYEEQHSRRVKFAQKPQIIPPSSSEVKESQQTQPSKWDELEKLISDLDEESTSSPIEEEPTGTTATTDWTVKELHERLQRDKLLGLCNALGVAWLIGYIKPVNNTLGVNEKNYEHLKKLKHLLDYFIAGFFNFNYKSQEVSLMITNYLDKKFSEISEENKVKKIEEWLSNAVDITKDEYNDLKENLTGDKKVGEVKNCQITISANDIKKAEEELNKLHNEEFLKTNLPEEMSYYGFITITQEYDEEYSGPKGGHEMAISYNNNTKTFMLFDQNKSLTKLESSERKNQINTIADHLLSYVKNPLPGAINLEVDFLIILEELED